MTYLFRVSLCIDRKIDHAPITVLIFVKKGHKISPRPHTNPSKIWFFFFFFFLTPDSLNSYLLKLCHFRANPWPYDYWEGTLQSELSIKRAVFVKFSFNYKTLDYLGGGHTHCNWKLMVRVFKRDFTNYLWFGGPSGFTNVVFGHLEKFQIHTTKYS